MSFLLQGLEYYPADGFTGSIYDTLPPGYYTIDYNPDKGSYYVTPTKPFKINQKVYGQSDKYADRILETFLERQGVPTSACFNGLKGSGKSLLLKRTSINFVEKHNGVVLLLGQPFHGPSFNLFLQSITQDKIIVIDEFEKVYHEEEKRNGLLTLLDGVYPQHALFILTTNENITNHYKFEFFSNRPGRIYFNIVFRSVTPEIIREYCEDELQDKSRIEEILLFISQFDNFNMDMLTVLVREMNRHPSDSIDFLSKILNLKPSNISIRFSLNITVKELKTNQVYLNSELRHSKSEDFIKFLKGSANQFNIWHHKEDEEGEYLFDMYLQQEDDISSPSKGVYKIVSEDYETTVEVRENAYQEKQRHVFDVIN